MTDDAGLSQRAAASKRAAHAPGGQPRSRMHAISLVVRMATGVVILLAALAIAAVLVANRHQAIESPPADAPQRVRTIQAVLLPAEDVSRRWTGFGTARARDRADVAAEVSGRVIARPPELEAGVAVSSGETLVRIDEEDYERRLDAARNATAALAARLEGLDVDEERLGQQLAQVDEQLRLRRLELERLREARAGFAATELEMIRLEANLAAQEAERLRLQQTLDAVPSQRAALRSELSALQNEAALAERQLARTTVVSPISGIVQSLDVNVGEMLQAGQRVARIVDVQRIEIPLRLPVSAQGEVRIGDTAVVRARGPGVGAGEGQMWQARVARVAPEADPQTRTIVVFLEVQQDPPGNDAAAWSRLLMPGRFVSAELAARAGNGERLIVVPRRAIADDRVWVAVMDDAGQMRAQPRQVRPLYNIDGRFPELSEVDTEWTVVDRGIEPGDHVIVTNLDDLVPGARIDIVTGW